MAMDELFIWYKDDAHCPQCGGKVKYRIWESSCGGYEDYNFKCQSCGHDWWVDGCDS
jgi:transposase-like protein